MNGNKNNNEGPGPLKVKMIELLLHKEGITDPKLVFPKEPEEVVESRSSDGRLVRRRNTEEGRRDTSNG